MKLFQKLNNIILHDEDEQAPVIVYLGFYGYHIAMLSVAGFYFVQLIRL